LQQKYFLIILFLTFSKLGEREREIGKEDDDLKLKSL